MSNHSSVYLDMQVSICHYNVDCRIYDVDWNQSFAGDFGLNVCYLKHLANTSDMRSVVKGTSLKKRADLLELNPQNKECNGYN